MGSWQANAALLALRVFTGVAFVQHGLMKIQNPFGWMGPDATIPPVLQALAALSEFGGGLALIPGLLTRFAALGLLSTMSVAVFFHVSKGDPMVGMNGSWEPAGVYWVISLALLLRGAGEWSLDSLFFKKKI